MDKVFEALKRIETVFPLNKEGKPNVYKEYTNSVEPFYNDFNLVFNSLLELQAIKEAKSNEAMECLLDIKSNYKFYAHNNQAIDYQCSVITQALLKTQKYKKVWEIVKEKNIDIETLKYRLRVKNDDVYLHYKYDFVMTREEFDLLKEMLW